MGSAFSRPQEFPCFSAPKSAGRLVESDLGPPELMARRPTGSLRIALFAALQLVLQPLAAASMCSDAGMDGGGDCCCSSKAEPAAGHGGGCCESETLPSEGRGEEVVSHSDCDCIATPTPLPTTPPEAPVVETRGDGGNVAALPAARGGLHRLFSASQLRLVPPREPPPGKRRPLHLLIQVFLI